MTNYQVVPVEPESNGVIYKENGESKQPSAVVDNETSPKFKVYRRRWIMLFIFVMVSLTNAFQWIQYSIINNVIMKYFNVDSQTVDWTSMVYMVVYIPLIFPGAWLMDKMGLRVTLLIGSFGTALGAWIKVLGVRPDLFYVELIGQTVTAISQVFVLGVPPNVAAVWFGPEQVSSACAIGVFGNQFGVALGFLLPPVLVKIHPSLDETGWDLLYLSYGVAGICTVLFILVLLVFQAEPPLPPSAARLAQPESLHYLASIKKIVGNWNYDILLISYGINAGVFYAISTFLNQMVLEHYPQEEENAGRIGLTIVLCGMAGSVLCGVILDRTHKFKETTLIVYVLAFAGMVGYMFAFSAGYIAVIFVLAGLLGFFMTGYLPIGFEFAAELTYPEPEVTSSGLLNASAQVFGIIFTYLGGWLISAYGSFITNIVLSVALLVGAILTLLIRPTLRRQEAIQTIKRTQSQLSSNPI